MNKSFQVGWWLIIITVAVMYSISIPIAVMNPNINEYLLSLIGETGIIIPIIAGILYSKKSSDGIADTLGLRTFPPILLPLTLIMITGAQYFITYATMPIQMLLVIMFGSDTATTQMLIPDSVPAFILAFFVLCIAAPIFEEFLCRGVLIKLFERYGFTVCVLSTAFAFSLLHMEMRSFIPIFFIGLLLGIIRICTGSTILTIIMHSFNNFLSLCQLTFFDINNPGIESIILTFSAILFPAAVYITFVKLSKLMDYNLINRLTVKKTGVSVAMIICIVGFIGFNLILFLNRFINGLCFEEVMELFSF